MGVIKVTSIVKGIKIDQELWNEFKKHCIDLNTTLSNRIKVLIERDLKDGKE